MFIYYLRSKMEHQWQWCSTSENRKVNPGFYVGVPFLSSIYFLTHASVPLLKLPLLPHTFLHVYIKYV